MKMSMGQRLLGFAVAGAALMTSGAAFAELGQPAPWEYKLQESGSVVMDNIEWFFNLHDRNKDGFLTKDEVLTVSESLLVCEPFLPGWRIP